VVEPYIGAKALKNAGLAIALSFVFIVIYVWIRFSALSGLSAGVTALIALIHDVFVVFFAFALFGIPLNDAFVAVVLTIIGYSINDTIVVYDRIRENRKLDDKISVVELMNESTSQTLARSINTVFTTAVCVFIIMIASIVFHISSIREFSVPMFFGIITGCYSSICIAGTLWAFWEKRKEKAI
jgi:SecD/SecF fusion protein